MCLCCRDYKKEDNTGIFQDFVGKVGIKFHMDTEASPVMKACTQMMKSAVRQQRYRLKQKYFDPFLLNLVTRISPVKSMTDDQWNARVESWKNPKKMEICQKNKANLAQVKFHQTTGSCNYPVHCDKLGENTKMKNPLDWICSRSATTATRRKGT